MRTRVHFISLRRISQSDLAVSARRTHPCTHTTYLFPSYLCVVSFCSRTENSAVLPSFSPPQSCTFTPHPRPCICPPPLAPLPSPYPYLILTLALTPTLPITVVPTQFTGKKTGAEKQQDDKMEVQREEYAKRGISL